jgi:hypothetical protein
MERYALKTKGGETINSIKAHSLDEACKLFAKIKNITIEDLNKIFIVELFDIK